MFTLVVGRVGSTLPPLVYGPFNTEDEAEQEWENLEGMRSLFDDLLLHSVVPLQGGREHTPDTPAVPAPPAVVIYDYRYYLPYVPPASPLLQLFPNQPYPYRVTWSNGSYTVNGEIAP